MGDHCGEKAGAVFLGESSCARRSSNESCMPPISTITVCWLLVSVDPYLSLRVFFWLSSFLGPQDTLCLIGATLIAFRSNSTEMVIRLKFVKICCHDTGGIHILQLWGAWFPTLIAKCVGPETSHKSKRYKIDILYLNNFKYLLLFLQFYWLMLLSTFLLYLCSLCIVWEGNLF